MLPSVQQVSIFKSEQQGQQTDQSLFLITRQLRTSWFYFKWKPMDI